MPDSGAKKILFAAILIASLLGGFFVWSTNIAKAVDPAPTPIQLNTPGAPIPVRDTTNHSATGQMDPNVVGISAGQKGTQNTDPKDWNMQIPVLFHAIGGIFFLILKLLNGLVWLGANLADKILNITSFTKVNVVTIGWGITRDLANMFFALILLVMSISTILQIEGFTYKQILKRLVIAALLINFSLLFAGIIIDFAQVMTSYFLDAGAGDTGISANLTNGLKIVQTYDFSSTDRSVFEKLTDLMWGPTLQMIIEQFMAIILFIAAAFSFFAMSFFLIARIVAIWLLLIAAPLAWISFIVPGAPGQLGGLWNRWWKEFLNWTFFAPIYAFFLYLALTIAKNGVSLNTGNWGSGAAANTLPLQSGFFKTPETILQYIVIIFILLMGLKTAKEMGIAGADAVMNLGKTGMKFAGSWADRWAAKGEEANIEQKGLAGKSWAYFRRSTSFLSPTAWKKGWEARQAQKASESFPVAIGARQDIINRLLMEGKTDYRDRAVRFRVAQKEKEILSNSAEEIKSRSYTAYDKGDIPEMEAHYRKLTSQNDLNELFKDLQQKFKDLDFSMSAEGMINFVDHYLAPKMGQAQANRLGHDLTRILENNGGWIGRPWNYNGKTRQYEKISNIDKETGKVRQHEVVVKDENGKIVKDEKTGKIKREMKNMTVADVARSVATGEWIKQDPQPMIAKSNRWSYWKEIYDENGKASDMELTADGSAKLAKLNATQANRWFPQAQATAMFKNPDELKEINAQLYEFSLENMAKDIHGMDDNEINIYLNRKRDDVPGGRNRDAEITNLKKLLKEKRDKIDKKTKAEETKKQRAETREKREEEERKKNPK